jgi:hypothetical protein
MAMLCGLCQPLFAIISGNLANSLLLLSTEDPQFYRDGFQAVVMFIGVGVFLCIVAFMQVRIALILFDVYLFSSVASTLPVCVLFVEFVLNICALFSVKMLDGLKRITVAH